MAEATVFETGRLTDVWTPAGRDPGGAIRYRRANFDVLLWAASSANVPENYVLPLGLERTSGADIALKADGSPQIGQDFGYYSSESMILETYQGDGMSDAIQSLHAFGPV